MILSKRDDPPAKILASRRSRRMRACFCEGDSTLAGSEGVSIEQEEVGAVAGVNGGILFLGVLGDG